MSYAASMSLELLRLELMQLDVKMVKNPAKIRSQKTDLKQSLVSVERTAVIDEPH
jgi:hypothetical protein